MTTNIPKSKELIKLQSLCDIVNRRYKNDLNDDDAVSAMFKYANKQSNVVVLIGYDTYEAISIDQAKEYQNHPATELYLSEEEKIPMMKIWHNNNIYRTKQILG